MDKSEKLKNAILNEYKSIREFSKVVDIPNSTIVSALDKGIGGMAVDKVIKICEVLNLDVKTFEKISCTKISNQNKELSNKETVLLLRSFNNLNDIGQHEATKRVEELACIGKYKKEKEHLILRAAHEIEGSSEEDKLHDYNLMDDKNF